MHLQQGTRSDILARTQRLGEAGLRRPPLPAVTATRERAGAVDPSQRQTSTTKSAADPAIDPDVVRAVQRELIDRGYEAGPVDGVAHAVTRAAVMAYEHDHGLPLTGQPSEDLLKKILFGVPPGAADKRAHEPLPQAQEMIRSVQESLASLGYSIKVDGRMGEETARTIRDFESKHGLTPSGRVSGALLLKLREATLRRKQSASVR